MRRPRSKLPPRVTHRRSRQRRRCITLPPYEAPPGLPQPVATAKIIYSLPWRASNFTDEIGRCSLCGRTIHPCETVYRPIRPHLLLPLICWTCGTTCILSFTDQETGDDFPEPCFGGPRRRSAPRG